MLLCPDAHGVFLLHGSCFKAQIAFSSVAGGTGILLADTMTLLLPVMIRIYIMMSPLFVNQVNVSAVAILENRDCLRRCYDDAGDVLHMLDTVDTIPRCSTTVP